MKDHADYATEAEIRANIDEIAERVKKGIRSPEELERDAYFTDPANAEEIAATFARIELVKEMYKAQGETFGLAGVYGPNYTLHAYVKAN